MQPAALALVAVLASSPPLVQPDASTLIPVNLQEEEDTSNLWVVTGVSAGMVALLLGWGTKAWWEDGLQPFSVRETGAFGYDTYAGGADKAGHAYSNYMMTHFGVALYRALGVSRTRAAWYSAIGTFLVSNWVELIDGFTEFGFEYGDVIANTSGIALGLLTKLYPELEDSVGFRIGYVPSRDFLDNEKSVLKWINDYSGMSFYLDLKVRGILRAAGEDPGLWRFLQFGVVYGTENYAPIRRNPERARKLGVHVGLDFAEFLRWQSDEDEGVMDVAAVFDYYAVPFLSIALVRDLDNHRWFMNFGVANRFQIGL